MSKRHKKVCTALDYIEYLHTLFSTIKRYVLISALAQLVNIPVSNASFAVGLKICAITT